MENVLDEKDLKIQALLEDISQLTTQYKNQIADLRVALTVTSQKLEQANAELEEKNASEKPKKTS